jgi:hypothetical protein
MSSNNNVEIDGSNDRDANQDFLDNLLLSDQKPSSPRRPSVNSKNAKSSTDVFHFKKQSTPPTPLL